MFVHLIMCPNNDFFHGAKGGLHITYLIIPDVLLCITHVMEEDERVARWRIRATPGRNVWLEDVEEMTLLGILHDNPDWKVGQAIFRVCGECRKKGVHP